MDKFFTIILFVPLTYLALFILFIFPRFQDEQLEFDQLVLRYQVNYASDAATEFMLDNTDDINTDYTNMSPMVDPDKGVHEFLCILASSLHYPMTEKGLMLLAQDYLKVALVCVDDGVYCYSQRAVSDVSWELVSTPKIPYFFSKEIKGEIVQYNLCLNLDKYYRDELIDDKYYRHKLVDAKDSAKYKLSKDERLTAIGFTISDILYQVLVDDENSDTYYSIPSNTSEISGAQAVKSISLIGVVNFPKRMHATTKPLMGIGGSYIAERDPLVFYKSVVGGKKWYCYQSEVKSKDLTGLTKINIDPEPASAIDAACDGFYYIY